MKDSSAKSPDRQTYFSDSFSRLQALCLSVSLSLSKSDPGKKCHVFLFQRFHLADGTKGESYILALLLPLMMMASGWLSWVIMGYVGLVMLFVEKINQWLLNPIKVCSLLSVKLVRNFAPLGGQRITHGTGTSGSLLWQVFKVTR